MDEELRELYDQGQGIEDLLEYRQARQQQTEGRPGSKVRLNTIASLNSRELSREVTRLCMYQ